MNDDTALALDAIPTTGPSAWLIAPTVTVAVVLAAITLAALAVAWWRVRQPGEFALAIACWRAGISRETHARILTLARQNGLKHPCAVLLCPTMLANAGLFDAVSDPAGSRVQSRDESSHKR